MKSFSGRSIQVVFLTLCIMFANLGLINGKISIVESRANACGAPGATNLSNPLVVAFTALYCAGKVSIFLSNFYGIDANDFSRAYAKANGFCPTDGPEQFARANNSTFYGRAGSRLIFRKN